ncbi:MAG: DNA-3-methyladenine glycosylase 2 family protein, partial [Chloroflexi bacterium]|nr:DNA-3-methyladenine glycosylase 2 family protein [Chloroflexota bacterium]
MLSAEWPLDGPIDLLGTLRPLVRGQGDRTIRLLRDEAWWTTRTSSGPATLRLRVGAGRLRADAFGPGGTAVLERAPRLIGLDVWGAASTAIEPRHPIVREMLRRYPGLRASRTEAVLDALVPAILEQKVTGGEARHVWHGLVRRYGEAAPGPPELGLRLAPSPAILVALPYHAYHPLGLERRRAELIRSVASRAAWFEAIAELPLAEAHRRLLSVPGIGPWTSAEVAVRALGDADAVSVGDFHLPNLVSWLLAGEPRGDDARMLALLEPYRGQR